MGDVLEADLVGDFRHHAVALLIGHQQLIGALQPFHLHELPDGRLIIVEKAV